MCWQKNIAGILALLALFFVFWLADVPGGRLPAFAFVCGLSLGVVMQRSRFCFYCHLRDWFEEENPRGALALLLAIGVGIAGYTVVLGSWLPTPTPGNIPPDVHVGPVSPALFLAGLVFGGGMVISGSCISAHWYRLAEGASVSPFALAGASIGFMLGFKSWNALYSLAIADAPVVWLPAHLGYGGALLAQLAVLVLLAALLWRGFARESEAPPLSAGRKPSFVQTWARLWEERWPYWIGGLAVGLIGVLVIIRMKPLGVTATIAAWSRKLAGEMGWIPEKLNGLDGFAGCGSVAQETWLNTDVLLLAGLLVGAFIAALAARQVSLPRPTPGDVARGLCGGVLLGWGAMVGLGCTVGTLLSGSHAGALSGWVFGFAMLLAIWGGLKIKALLLRRLGVATDMPA